MSELRGKTFENSTSIRHLECVNVTLSWAGMHFLHTYTLVATLNCYSMFSDLHDSYLLLPHEFFSLFFYHQKETFLVQGQRFTLCQNCFLNTFVLTTFHPILCSDDNVCYSIMHIITKIGSFSNDDGKTMSML